MITSPVPASNLSAQFLFWLAGPAPISFCQDHSPPCLQVLFKCSIFSINATKQKPKEVERFSGILYFPISISWQITDKNPEHPYLASPEQSCWILLDSVWPPFDQLPVFATWKCVFHRLNYLILPLNSPREAIKKNKEYQ